MIYCKLSDVNKYQLYSKNFGIAIDYIINTDLRTLKMGKTQILGDLVYINKIEIDTKAYDEIKYESHRKYIDIHILLDWDEKIQSINSAKSISEYNVENDYYLFNSLDYSTEVILSKKSLCNLFCK